MSNWGAQSTDNDNFDSQWLKKLRNIEDNLRKIKSDSDNISQKFIWCKQNNGNMDSVQKWLMDLKQTCQETTQLVFSLAEVVPKSHEIENIGKRNQLKQIEQRVNQQVKHVQNLTDEVRRELERRYLEKKQSIGDQSILVTDTGRDSRGSGNFQMSQLECEKTHQELIHAEEEMEQMQKLAKETNQLQEMFQKMHDLIYEDRERVDNIVSNIEQVDIQVEEGNKELQQATTYKTSAFKKKIIIGAIVFIIIVVIILIIVLSVYLEKK